MYRNLSQCTYDRLLAHVAGRTKPALQDVRDLLRAYEDALTLLRDACYDSYSVADGTDEFLDLPNGQPRVELRDEPNQEEQSE